MVDKCPWYMYYIYIYIVYMFIHAYTYTHRRRHGHGQQLPVACSCFTRASKLSDCRSSSAFLSFKLMASIRGLQVLHGAFLLSVGLKRINVNSNIILLSLAFVPSSSTAGLRKHEFMQQSARIIILNQPTQTALIKTKRKSERIDFDKSNYIVPAPCKAFRHRTHITKHCLGCHCRGRLTY